MVIVAFLVACRKEAQKPAQEVKPQVQAQKAAAAKEATPEAKPEEGKVETETYVYDPKGRRDPFLSIIESAKKERDTEKRKKGLRPSEAFDVSEIKIIAIASDRKNSYAMVLFPDNKYYTVKEGMTLGAYGGKVVKITPESIVVRELIKNYKGETLPKDTILKLRKEEGE